MPQQLKTRIMLPALALLAAVTLWAAPAASAAGPYTMTISSTASDSNVTCSVGTCTPTAPNATLSLATLESDLSGGDLSVGDGGEITLDSSIDAVNLNNNLTFNGPVSLGGDTDITNSGLVTFSSTVDASGPGQNLDVNSDTVFDAAVGSLAPHLGSLTVSGPATATLGGNVSTSGAQSYGGAVSLATSGVTLTSTGGSLTFSSTVDGASNLRLSAGNTVSLDGAVGGSQDLASLVIPTAAAIDIAAAVNTEEAQEYSAPVTLTGDATISSGNNPDPGDITFGSTIDGAQALEVSASGTLDFGGAIGSGTPLTSFVVATGGSSAVTELYGNVTTTGLQSYGSVTLETNVRFTSASNVNFGTFPGGSPVTGDYQLTMSGAGTMMLPDTSDSMSSTVVSGGATVAFSPGALGSGPISLNGGTLLWGPYGSTNTDDVSSQLQIGAGGGTLDTNDNDVTFAHSVGGTDTLTKTGAGTLMLNASTGSRYGNQIVVDGGSVAVSPIATLSTPVLVQSGGELDCYDGTITGGVTNQGGTTTGAPGAPTDVTASAGSPTANISFTPGPDNCNPVSYTATSGALTWGPVAAGPITATGLASGQPYTFTVTATNPIGSSSAVSNTVTTPFMPTVAIASPVNNATYTQGQVVYASYTCQEGSGGTGIATCAGPVASGAALDTQTPGTHTFAATATSSDGYTATATATYTVVASTSSSVKPPNKFTIRQLNAHPSGSIDVSLASLVGAGTVKVTEHPTGLRAFTARKTASAKTTLKFTVAPSSQLKTWLKRHHGKLNVKVSIIYTPRGGKARTVTKNVKV